MPEYALIVPGLPGGPLLTDYPITVNLIPSSNTFQRPGTPARTPRRSVQHGTGNPNNPDARAEAQYFVNGAEGRQASIHYCSDDVRAVVVVPLNEVTWQAADGSGPGNMNGFSCEMMEADAIWNNVQRRADCIAVAADLMGRTAARLGCHTGPEQHWTFNAGDPNRHDCPNKLRHVTMPDGRLAWDHYAEQWNEARIDELRRMGGTATTTTTAPPVSYPPKRVPAPDAMSAQGHPLTTNDPKRYQSTQGGHFKTGPSLHAPDASVYRAGRWYTFDYSSTVDGVIWLVSKAGSWAPLKNFEVLTR